MLGGVAMLSRARTDGLLDTAIAQITLKPTDRTRFWLLLVGAVLTVLSGVALVAQQAAFLVYASWSARREGDAEARPRSSTVNAAAVSVGVLAVVVVLANAGRLS